MYNRDRNIYPEPEVLDLAQMVDDILAVDKADLAMTLNVCFGKLFNGMRKDLQTEQKEFLTVAFGLKTEDFKTGFSFAEPKVRLGTLAYTLLNQYLDEEKSEKLLSLFQEAIIGNKDKTNVLTLRCKNRLEKDKARPAVTVDKDRKVNNEIVNSLPGGRNVRRVRRSTMGLK